MTEKLNKESISEAVAGLPIPQIVYFEETDSTNEQALRLAANQAEEFTLVIAERQSAGRGRLGRHWVTMEGTSLAFTIVLKPAPAEIPHLSIFSLLGGLATCQAIHSTYGICAQVKWPNDVLLDGMKTAGILAESCWQNEQLSDLVLGIGINVLAGSVPPAKEMLFPATCVQTHCSQPVERLVLLRAVLEKIIGLRGSILESSFIEKYSRHMAFIGQSVKLDSNSGEAVIGELVGVDQDGRVILRDENGEEKSSPIGDLHLRPQDVSDLD